MTTRLIFLTASVCVAGALAWQAVPAAMPAPGPMPDPLVMRDGTKVTTAAQWRDKRRPELLELFTREMYGVAPPRSSKLKFEVFDKGTEALGGKAIRKQVTVLLEGDPNGPKFDLLVYLPKAAKGPVPAILGINFWGNHTVSADPGIRLTASRVESSKNQYADLSCAQNGKATEACRGVNSPQWPLEEMMDRGYALATLYRGEVDPDTKDGFDMSLKRFYPALQGRGDNFSTIGEWAWALSRAMDYLVTDKAVDPKKVAVFGWSRLGKAAIWAAATDERFAAVISNDSGAGGAKLFHRGVAENVTRLNTSFPHWFDTNFRAYNDRDTALPFDQHEVMSLIAPRPLYVASAIDDKNADPEGEFEGAKGAEPVYRLLGAKVSLPEKWPAVDEPVGDDVAYHVRTGGHDVKPFDWARYLGFLDRKVK